MSGKEFYLRSFTWGFPVNAGGFILSTFLLAAGVKPQRFGRCVQFEVGRNWGGGSLGVFMFTCKNASKRLKEHEHGHGLQNCYYGPMMPLLVNVPSTARYWFRRVVQKLAPEKKLPPYDSIWFEAEATKIGKEYVEYMENREKELRNEEFEKQTEENREDGNTYKVLRTASRILLGGLAAVLTAEAIQLKKRK